MRYWERGSCRQCLEATINCGEMLRSILVWLQESMMEVRAQESSSESRSTSEPKRYQTSQNVVDSITCRCIVRTAKLSLLAKVEHFPRRLFTPSNPTKEIKMATKKAAKKRGPASTILRFKKEWIFDPGPEWLRINRAALTRINQLKEDFAKRVNEAIKTGQQ